MKLETISQLDTRLGFKAHCSVRTDGLYDVDQTLDDSHYLIATAIV